MQKYSHFPQSGIHLPTYEFCILIFVHNGDFEICEVTSFSQIYRKSFDSGKNKFAYFMMCYTLLCSSQLTTNISEYKRILGKPNMLIQNTHSSHLLYQLNKRTGFFTKKFILILVHLWIFSAKSLSKYATSYTSCLTLNKAPYLLERGYVIQR